LNGVGIVRPASREELPRLALQPEASELRWPQELPPMRMGR